MKKTLGEIITTGDIDALALNLLRRKHVSPNASGCWIWSGTTANKIPVFQYRRIEDGRSTTTSIRRAIAIMNYGEIVLLHHHATAACGEPACVNPKHVMVKIPHAEWIQALLRAS